MRCLEYKPSFHEVADGKKTARYVTVLSAKYVTIGHIRQYGNKFEVKRFQIKFIDNNGKCIITTYSGKKSNILKLKIGNYIKMEAVVVRSHEEIDGNQVTIVSHVKNLSS